MRKLWPTDQPAVSRPCSKASVRALASASFAKPISAPTLRTRTGSCAFAGIAWSANAPPSNVMNSRRLMGGLPQGQDHGLTIAGLEWGGGVHRNKRGRRMTAWGQTLPSRDFCGTAALPLKPDIGWHGWHVRNAITGQA